MSDYGDHFITDGVGCASYEGGACDCGWNEDTTTVAGASRVRSYSFALEINKKPQLKDQNHPKSNKGVVTN